MMVSLGYPDGETIDKREYLAAVARISRVLTVPLSVDLVAGFGESAGQVAATVKEVVKAGAVGINLEDFLHASKKLFAAEKQVEKIRAVKKLRESLGVAIVINARTDALRFAEGDESAKLDEAIRRATAYRDAGADCVYPMGLVDPVSIRTFVKAFNFPTNVMVRKGLPSIRELETLGVARLSFGPTASYAAMGLLKRISREVLDKGTFNGLVDGAITYDELSNLTTPRK
jgi:2-methylisocitrate lyase-like PEP mutase family enzyme